MHNLHRTKTLLSAALFFSVISQAAHAERTFDTQAASQGQAGRTSYATGQGPQGVGARVTSNATSKQIPRYLAPAGLGSLTNQGLPKTNLDSFVAQAGGQAELIYGDEGTDGPPPYDNFTEEHRIERGIHDGGLTTNHKSGLPEAWGWPELTQVVSAPDPHLRLSGLRKRFQP